MANMKKSTQAGLLIAAIAAGAIAAAATRTSSKPTSSRPSSNPIPELAAATERADQPAADASALQGTILEIIQVPSYTYLRIGASGQTGTWAAVTTAEDVKVGDAVRVVQAQAMHDFKSSALKRTFETIYFGALEAKGNASGASANAKDNPHAGMDMGQNPHAMPPGPGGETNPHAQVGQSGESVPLGKVAVAKGELGHAVADIYAKRAALSGKTVRVRAVVVKAVAGVMGKNFLHVRDGSGNDKAGTHDLTVTTQAEPKVGDTILVEGKLGTDVDFGAGYKYPVIIQDAQLISE